MKNMDSLRTDKHQFDDESPPSGHQLRFERKLAGAFPTKHHFQWWKIAAVFVIALGIGLGWNFFPTADRKAGLQPIENQIPLNEAEYYYQKSVKMQLTSITKNYTSKESVQMIEESQELLDELALQYKELENELKKTGNQKVAAAMISNYKSRIEILESLIEKLNYVTKLKNQKHENHTS